MCVQIRRCMRLESHRLSLRSASLQTGYMISPRPAEFIGSIYSAGLRRLSSLFHHAPLVALSIYVPALSDLCDSTNKFGVPQGQKNNKTQILGRPSRRVREVRRNSRIAATRHGMQMFWLKHVLPFRRYLVVVVLVDVSCQTLDVRPCNALPPQGCFHGTCRAKHAKVI